MSQIMVPIMIIVMIVVAIITWFAARNYERKQYDSKVGTVSYTHLTLPTTPYV